MLTSRINQCKPDANKKGTPTGQSSNQDQCGQNSAQQRAHSPLSQGHRQERIPVKTALYHENRGNLNKKVEPKLRVKTPA
jgi:hypothetical protein